MSKSLIPRVYDLYDLLSSQDWMMRSYCSSSNSSPSDSVSHSLESVLGCCHQASWAPLLPGSREP